MPKVQIFCCCLAVLLYPSLGAGLERDTSVVWDPTRFRDQIEDFVIADDNSLWVVQEQRITHFSTQQGYTNYYTRDGLPAAIKLLVKDNNGNIWCFGTQDKQLVISRFDGQSWQAGISLPERLRDNPDLFSTVLFDRNNDLWIGTSTDFIGYYTGRSPPGAGLFFMGSSFSAHYTEENDLLQNAVLDLMATADGSIWVATSQGINRFKEQQWTSYTQHQGLFANATFELVEMPHGELWAFHEPGISIFDPASQTWQPASSHVMPAHLGSFLLRTANNNIFFSDGGPGLVRYIQDNWIRVPSQSGFPDHVDIIKQDASGTYWVLHEGILNLVVPKELPSITIKGTITNKIDGTPWLHGAVRLDTHEEALIAWSKTDDNGRYTMQVFAASTPTLDEANTYRLSVVDADGSIEVELDHLGINTIDLSVEKTEQSVDLRLFIVLLGCSLLIVIGFCRYKWTSNFLIDYSPLVFIGFILVLVMFYCLYNGTFIVPYVADITSLVWSIAFSFLIRFSNTNQILPLCLLRTHSRYGAYHYYKANVRSWTMVPIFPAIFCLVMIIRHIKDPAQLGPYMAISVLVMLYSIINYVVALGYQSRSILRLQLENRWMEDQFRFLFGLGMIVIFVLGTNTIVITLSFFLSSSGVIAHLTNSLADFCLNLFFSALYFLSTVQYLVAGLVWIIVSIGAALVVFTPSTLTAKQRQVIFWRNLSFVLCVSSYVISILLWVHTLTSVSNVEEAVKATALSILFPSVGLGLAGLIQWWSRQFTLPQAAPLEAAQYSSNKWLSGTLFVLCITSITLAAESVRVEESLIISVIIFFFIVWMARRRTHLENLISQRTAELQQEKALVEAENIRKTGELEEARNLQLSMLPQEKLVHPDIEIAFNMKPASEVGGDYFDFKLLANRTLTIAIGDATGHGLRAGILVTATKSLFQVLSQETDLRHILSSISQTLKNMHLKRMNMALTLLKISNRKLTLSAAGMPPVLLYRAATKQVEEILLEGMPLGISSRSQYSEYKCDLQTGDTLLLMSDGLPERLNPAGDLFDYSRVQQHFLDLADRPPEDICTQMWQAGEHWSAGHPQDDDVTLVAFKVK